MEDSGLSRSGSVTSPTARGYECMTAEELALWLQTAELLGATRPCIDCPAPFRRRAIEQGSCRFTPRPRRVLDQSPRAVRSREYHRDWMRRFRAGRASGATA